MATSLPFLGLALAGLLSASPSERTELSYRWKAGDLSRYLYEETTHFKSGMGKPPLDGILTVRSTFAEKVLAPQPEGAAKIELVLEKLEIGVGTGPTRTLDLHRLRIAPLGARVDRQGHRVLERVWAVYPGEGQLLLGIRRVGALPNDPVAEPLAWFDPETGILSGVAQLSAKQKALAERAVKQEPLAACVPHGLWDLLAFPPATPVSGRAVVVQHQAGAVDWSLTALDGSMARFRVMSASSRPGKEALAAKLNADLTSRFDTQKGQLMEARGTLITRQSIQRNSKVLLQRL